MQRIQALQGNPGNDHGRTGPHTKRVAELTLLAQRGGRYIETRLGHGQWPVIEVPAFKVAPADRGAGRPRHAHRPRTGHAAAAVPPPGYEAGLGDGNSP